MKRFTPLVAALALAGCANLQVDTGRTLSYAQSSVAAAEAVAHSAYVSGAISKDQVRQVAKFVDMADDLSLSARCVYAKGDMTTTLGILNNIGALALAISAITSHQPVPATPTLVGVITCANPAPVSAVVVPASAGAPQ